MTCGSVKKASVLKFARFDGQGWSQTNAHRGGRSVNKRDRQWRKTAATEQELRIVTELYRGRASNLNGLTVLKLSKVSRAHLK